MSASTAIGGPAGCSASAFRRPNRATQSGGPTCGLRVSQPGRARGSSREPKIVKASSKPSSQEAHAIGRRCTAAKAIWSGRSIRAEFYLNILRSVAALEAAPARMRQSAAATTSSGGACSVWARWSTAYWAAPVSPLWGRRPDPSTSCGPLCITAKLAATWRLWVNNGGIPTFVSVRCSPHTCRKSGHSHSAVECQNRSCEPLYARRLQIGCAMT